MFFNDVAYAMGSAGQAGGDSAFGSPLSMNILLMVVIFAIFYFLIIRPQHKEAKNGPIIQPGDKASMPVSPPRKADAGSVPRFTLKGQMAETWDFGPKAGTSVQATVRNRTALCLAP